MEAAGTRCENWVLRIQATTHQIYEDASVEKQYRVLKTLGETGSVPVPDVLWFEPDADVLGAPFFLMERVEGTVPEGRYHSCGFLADRSAAARTRLWHTAIKALASIHALEPNLFAFLDKPDLGSTGMDQEVARWISYSRWSGVPLEPVQEKGWEWLLKHFPDERPTGLAWGDARLPNMIFQGGRLRAVIDWETVSLGGAETDLAWWLFFDWYVSAGMGVPRLEGVPGRDETLQIWEQLSGRKAHAMDWHEVFATLRYSMISARAQNLTGNREAMHPSLRRLAELTGG